MRLFPFQNLVEKLEAKSRIFYGKYVLFIHHGNNINFFLRFTNTKDLINCYMSLFYMTHLVFLDSANTEIVTFEKVYKFQDNLKSNNPPAFEELSLDHQSQTCNEKTLKK